MPSSFFSRRRVMLTGLALLAFPVSGSAQTADISGVYLAEGRNPDGTAYHGTAVLAEREGAVQINWTMNSKSYSGTGRRDGQVVVVDWGQGSPVVYVIMPGGALHGTWADGTALERLTRK